MIWINLMGYLIIILYIILKKIMGFVFSKIFSGLVGSEQQRIIIIGLDNAGKTTILCKLIERWWKLTNLFFSYSIDRLHLNEVEPTVPSKECAIISNQKRYHQSLFDSSKNWTEL